MVERLSKSVLYTFGVADLFFLLMVNMELYLFPAFLTDYAQFPLLMVTYVLWITSVADIGCALAAGFMLQRMNLRFGGKYRSWLLVGPPIVAPLFILQFTKIGSDMMAAWVIIIAFVTSHLVFNVVFAATGSMVGTLSQLSDERTILSSSRAQGMAASGLIFSATGLPMVVFFGAYVGSVIGVTIATAVFAGLMILGYWYIYRITAGKDPDDQTMADAANGGRGQSWRDIIGLVFKNRPLLQLIIAEVFRNTCIFMVGSFAFYYFSYVTRDPAFLSMFILAISVAGLAGTFVAAWIGVKVGKRHAYWAFMMLAAIGFATAQFFGNTAWSFTAIFCIATMFGMIAGSMSTALFADTVVYGEWKTGRNIRAFTMALLVLPIKVGGVLRSAIMTAGLLAIGYVANTDPTPRVAEGISSIMSFSPAAACALGAVVFYFGYKIDDKQVLEMQADLAGRTASQPAG